jgi:co-chaperonin GroES (HSP10)
VVTTESSGVRIERKSTDVIPQGQTLRPLRDHLIVKRLDWEPSKTIQVAGDTRKTLRGVVVAAGPGCYPWRYNSDRSKRKPSAAFRKTETKVGDIVQLGGLEAHGYGFPEILIDNELHIICREEDVCGIE